MGSICLNGNGMVLDFCYNFSRPSQSHTTPATPRAAAPGAAPRRRGGGGGGESERHSGTHHVPGAGLTTKYPHTRPTHRAISHDIPHNTRPGTAAAERVRSVASHRTQARSAHALRVRTSQLASTPTPRHEHTFHNDIPPAPAPQQCTRLYTPSSRRLATTRLNIPTGITS